MEYKTQISAHIVADSINPQGDRLVSVMLTMWRCNLAELNTHRMLSKNSASSRAIPYNRMINSIKENPFIPTAFQKEHTGMQGTEYITDQQTIDYVTKQWLFMRDTIIDSTSRMTSNEVTKQITNRPLEPWMYHTVLVTGNMNDSAWGNFFKLRCPQYETPDGIFRSIADAIEAETNRNFADSYRCPDFDNILEWLKINKGQAEIHIMELAECIWDAVNESIPEKLAPGEWHIPFIDKIEAGKHDLTMSDIIKVSTAMAARTSYTVVGDEKEISYERLLEIHDRMANANPKHFSPFEHCSRVMTELEYSEFKKGRMIQIDEGDGIKYGSRSEGEEGWCNNFKGFIQYRYLLENKI